MTTIQCTYPDRDAVLVAYLYDDIDPAERVAFDTHVMTCLRCRSELADLRGVRETLGRWAPPEPVRAFTSRDRRAPDPARRAAWWRDIPVWAQVAAAMLVLGVSAAVANLDVRYDRSGLTVTTGWSRRAQPPAAQTAAAPWRGDLAALRGELESELRQAVPPAAAAATAATTTNDAQVARRVRALLDESERRQQNELALRLAQAERDWSAQRQADLRTINQNLGYIQTNTYGELLKQREGMNYLLRVSQKR